MHKLLEKLFWILCPGFDRTNTGTHFESKKNAEQKEKLQKRGVYCKHCQAKISHPSHAIEIQGAYQHRFTNPEGMTFDIGLYNQAECLAVSEPIHEHSWFSGYAWQIVVCHQCRSHLGWSYSNKHSPNFYGLILNRILIIYT